MLTKDCVSDHHDRHVHTKLIATDYIAWESSVNQLANKKLAQIRALLSIFPLDYDVKKSEVLFAVSLFLY